MLRPGQTDVPILGYNLSPSKPITSIAHALLGRLRRGPGWQRREPLLRRRQCALD